MAASQKKASSKEPDKSTGVETAPDAAGPVGEDVKSTHGSPVAPEEAQADTKDKDKEQPEGLEVGDTGDPEGKHTAKTLAKKDYDPFLDRRLSSVQQQIVADELAGVGNSPTLEAVNEAYKDKEDSE